ncbi:MAG: hypothetical protein JST51_11105 [Armatimonadetes bacterium]|nr:hypothetical protein [Armatimonadota bacterium]
MDSDKSERKWHSRTWIGRSFAAVLIVLGALITAYGIAPWRFRPGLTLAQSNLRLRVGTSKIATGKFRIINNTMTPIRLSKASGCSCLDLRFDSDYLLPLESTEGDLSVATDSVKLGVWNLATIKVNGHDDSRLDLRFLAYLGDRS